MSITPSAPPDASGTVRGLVNLAAQTFAGAKTFAAQMVAAAGIQMNAQLLAGSAYTFGAGGFFGANPAWVTTNTTKFIIQNGTPISGFAGIDVRATGGVQLASALGTGASDVCAKVGSSQADGSVNANAKLFSVRTGLSGTEIEKFWVTKSSGLRLGTGGLFHGAATDSFFAARYLDINDSSLKLRHDVISLEVAGEWRFLYEGVNYPAILRSTGRLDQTGTDDSANAGNRTVNKPTGINKLANGATTCVITNSLCSATSRVMVTFHDDPGSRYWVTRAAGSFTVNLSSAAGADKIFSWEVSNIL